MTEELLFGADALDAMQDTGESGDGAEFTSFSSGSSFMVKVPNLSKEEGKVIPLMMSFFSYGIYKKINSFVAANPSKKSKKGYPVEDLTPWDKAWKYHKDLSNDWQDAHGQEASKYRPKHRYAMVFINLDDGKPIIVDLSKKQATAVYAEMKKRAGKLGTHAFELSKQGESTDTTVTLSIVIDAEEELSAAQQKHLKEASTDFDTSIFEGLLYEQSDEDMIASLVDAGFDVRLIGLEPPIKAASTTQSTPPADDPFAKSSGPIDVPEDELPF